MVSGVSWRDQRIGSKAAHAVSVAAVSVVVQPVAIKQIASGATSALRFQNAVMGGSQGF